MNWHPILFQADMIRAVLNCKPNVWPAEPIDPSKPFKWQTRRIDRRFMDAIEVAYYINLGSPKDSGFVIDEDVAIRCPYGRIGHMLWVKENFQILSRRGGGQTVAKVSYVADGIIGYAEIPPSQLDTPTASVRPKINIPRFMPRWASRLSLEVKRVRVQRVQDTTPADVDAEGVSAKLVESLIEARAQRLRVEPEHWIYGADQAPSYCPECCRKEVRLLQREDPKGDYGVDGGWGSEGDGPALCEKCGVWLDTAYTDEACTSELAHFETCGFDIAGKDDCYSLCNILDSQIWGKGPLADRIKRLGMNVLWDSINAARGYSWKSNPWVWTVDFMRTDGATQQKGS